jgi:glycosyltransferase involved in cell wall biosynthesis
MTDKRIAVVIPAYRVRGRIMEVLSAVGPEVHCIYVVDDACPEASGKYVQEQSRDSRVRVLFHQENQGVGAATLTGFSAALADGCDILVKIDGDGQMDPQLLPAFVQPVLSGDADYAKGNRFYDIDTMRHMPIVRGLGNLALSFLTKLSSGYWHMFDPNNGYVAIDSRVARLLNFSKIDPRYFFESDMLFRLNIIGAVVCDVPMDARYAGEESSMRLGRVLFEFSGKHIRNATKRILYNYFLRDFNVASLQLIGAIVCFVFGVTFGAIKTAASLRTGIAAPAGTVMLAALPTLFSGLLAIAFLSYDIGRNPTIPLQRRVPPLARRPARS